MSDFIDVNERLPEEVGFYEVKTNFKELDGFSTYYVRNYNGDLVWLTDQETIKITHWKPNSK